MKKALLLHYDLFDTFSLLSDEELGKLLRAVYEYDTCGITPDFEDRMMTACFMRIADCLDRNNSRYEEVCQKRAESARKRWEKIRQSGVEN